MNIFIILDTPPELNGKTLQAEIKAQKLQKVVLNGLPIFVLCRGEGDTAVIARRIQNITLRELTATLQSYQTRSEETFKSLAETGDRVIVLNPNGRDWEQYLVA